MRFNDICNKIAARLMVPGTLVQCIHGNNHISPGLISRVTRNLVGYVAVELEGVPGSNLATRFKIIQDFK